MRDLLALDVETTGLKPEQDRICALSIGLYDPGSETFTDPIHHTDGLFTTLVNPTIPIPPETTEIHGIEDPHVENAPTFADLADDIQPILEPPILAYNARFDVGFLHSELRRCMKPGIPFNHPIIDPLMIERRILPHDLASVYERYVGEPLHDHHDPETDARAATRILVEQQEAHGWTWDHCLPTERVIREAFDENPRVPLDHAGHFYERDGTVFFGFGKHRDKPAAEHQDYLRWMLKRATFPDRSHEIARDLREVDDA